MIRLEDDYLFVEGNGEDLGVLDPAYVLGTVFTVKVVAGDVHVRVYYQEMSTPKVDVQRDADGCYFKAGDYTQSNTDTGDEADAFGQVVIQELTVTHR